jgi:purine-nucleoside phosphorylase
MQTLLDDLEKALRFLKNEQIQTACTVGIVMGSGLDAMSTKIKVEHTISYANIPGFPIATVAFHKGNLIVGTIGGVRVVAMQGRFHYYEGYSMQQITFPIRVLKELGVQYLLLSNAAGGMHPDYKKGDLVLLEDHINLLPDNPLRGLSDPVLGPRFVDMRCPYSTALNNRIQKICTEQHILLHKGVYVAVMGPNLETRAEYRWLRSMGADLVGMSTVPEVIVANQIGIPCAAVSVITDECDPDNLQPVNIAEIIAVANKSDETLSNIFLTLIAELAV